MSKYVDNVYLVTLECASCNMSFAVTQEFMKQRRRDHKTFYCPIKCSNWYPQKSDKEKLQQKLTQAQRKTQEQQQRALQAESERDASDRRYGRIRDRVKNGVCPCCTRTFQNLARHMATKHPAFGKEKKLKAIRLAYGLTQVDLSSELDLPSTYISAYENHKSILPDYAATRIEAWMDEQ